MLSRVALNSVADLLVSCYRLGHPAISYVELGLRNSVPGIYFAEHISWMVAQRNRDRAQRQAREHHDRPLGILVTAGYNLSQRPDLVPGVSLTPAGRVDRRAVVESGGVRRPSL